MGNIDEAMKTLIKVLIKSDTVQVNDWSLSNTYSSLDVTINGKDYFVNITEKKLAL